MIKSKTISSSLERGLIGSLFLVLGIFFLFIKKESVWNGKKWEEKSALRQFSTTCIHAPEKYQSSKRIWWKYLCILMKNTWRNVRAKKLPRIVFCLSARQSHTGGRQPISALGGEEAFSDQLFSWYLLKCCHPKHCHPTHYCSKCCHPRCIWSYCPRQI